MALKSSSSVVSSDLTGTAVLEAAKKISFRVRMARKREEGIKSHHIDFSGARGEKAFDFADRNVNSIIHPG